MSLAADKAKEILVRLGQKVAESGLVIGTWGNLSYRVARDDVVVITPSGLDYRRMSTRDMVIIGMDGLVVEGERKPSTELTLHLAVYRTRPDVQCVIHTHSPYAGAMAVNRMPIPAILEDAVAMIGGPVPVTEYAVSGSRRLAELAAAALGGVNAVLLANHGVVGVGRTPEGAFQVCQQVERAAQVYILARGIGVPVALTDQEVAVLLEHYAKEYGQRERGEG